jgi:hypothetical protein
MNAASLPLDVNADLKTIKLVHADHQKTLRVNAPRPVCTLAVVWRRGEAISAVEQSARLPEPQCVAYAADLKFR